MIDLYFVPPNLSSPKPLLCDEIKFFALAKKVALASQKSEEEETATEEGIPRITLSSEAKDLSWHVIKREENGKQVFVVTGAKIEKFARRTNFFGYENVNRLRDIMKKMGITHELTRQGALGDSIIRIGINEFTLVEQ